MTKQVDGLFAVSNSEMKAAIPLLAIKVSKCRTKLRNLIYQATTWKWR